MKNTKEFRSLVEWFSFIVHDRPLEKLVAQDESFISYQELNKKTSDLAGWLQTRARLSRSARVAIIAPDTIGYGIALFASWRMGACVIDLDLNKDIVDQCLKSKVEAVFVEASYADKIKELQAEGWMVLLIRPGDFKKGGWIKNLMPHQMAGATKITTALLEGSAMPYVCPYIQGFEAATIRHEPERCRLTHENLMGLIKAEKLTSIQSYSAVNFITQFFK